VFGSEPKDQYLDEYNLLVSQKQLDPDQTISSSQLDTLGQFFAATGLKIPSNWKDVFTKP
jgi:hypothetical protein